MMILFAILAVITLLSLPDLESIGRKPVNKENKEGDL
jgi:Tfp pilus assembly protein FimT